MAKRERFVRDLMAVASKLPWWLGVGFALVSFLVLHLVAGAFQTPATANELGDLSSPVILSGVHTFASIAEIILPIICLTGAAASFIDRVHGPALVGASAVRTTGLIASLGRQDFERLFCEAFRREGYRVEERDGSAGDGGVVVSSGTFTMEASTFARMAKIRLVDADALERMIAFTRSGNGVSATARDEAELAGTPAVPACPKCGARMVDRVARHGKFSGRHFWGCGQYPMSTECGASAKMSNENPPKLAAADRRRHG